MKRYNPAIHHYVVVRYFSDGTPPKCLRANVSLQEAIEHCNRPETSTTTSPRAKAKQSSVSWFDGYRDMNDFRYDTGRDRWVGPLTLRKVMECLSVNRE